MTHMDLLSYIAEPERRAGLAAATGSSPDYLWQVATARRKASPRLALLIEEKTRLATPHFVRKESLRPDIWPELAPLGKNKRAA